LGSLARASVLLDTTFGDKISTVGRFLWCHLDILSTTVGHTFAKLV